MAKKDKGTKPEKSKGKKAPEPEPKKSKKSKGGGAADGIGKPSEAKGGGDGWALADTDNVGKLLLFNPLREDSVGVTRKGKVIDTPIIVADVVELNEKKPEKSVLHEGVYVFGKWVQGSLRSFIGESRVLGRLNQDADKSQGDNPAWVLDDYDDDDIKVARAYLDSVDPFKTGGGKPNGSKGKKGK